MQLTSSIISDWKNGVTSANSSFEERVFLTPLREKADQSASLIPKTSDQYSQISIPNSGRALSHQINWKTIMPAFLDHYNSQPCDKPFEIKSEYSPIQLDFVYEYPDCFQDEPKTHILRPGDCVNICYNFVKNRNDGTFTETWRLPDVQGAESEKLSWIDPTYLGYHHSFKEINPEYPTFHYYNIKIEVPKDLSMPFNDTLFLVDFSDYEVSILKGLEFSTHSAARSWGVAAGVIIGVLGVGTALYCCWNKYFSGALSNASTTSSSNESPSNSERSDDDLKQVEEESQAESDIEQDIEAQSDMAVGGENVCSDSSSDSSTGLSDIPTEVPFDLASSA